MERIRRMITLLPPWLLTIGTTIAILWLTLAPRPLGENPPELFPGADKIVHGIMFGFLSLMISLDYERKHAWKHISGWHILLIGTICSTFGILIELLQLSMGYGRSFEGADIVADCAGVIICLSGLYLIENYKATHSC